MDLLQIQKTNIKGFEEAQYIRNELCKMLLNDLDLFNFIEDLKENSNNYTKSTFKYLSLELIDIIKSLSISQSEFVKTVLRNSIIK